MYRLCSSVSKLVIATFASRSTAGARDQGVLPVPETRVALTVVRWPQQVVVGITVDAWWRLRSTFG